MSMRDPGNRNFGQQFNPGQREPMDQSGDFLNEVVGMKEEIRVLSGFESGEDARKNEMLFKVTTEIEDTRNALRQAEQLVSRLKNRLDQLESMHRILTKKNK
jgi:hypothetical protein